MPTLIAHSFDVVIGYHPMADHDPECNRNHNHEEIAYYAGQGDERVATYAPSCLLYRMEDAAEDLVRQACELEDIYPDDESVRDAAVHLAARADMGMKWGSVTVEGSE